MISLIKEDSSFDGVYDFTTQYKEIFSEDTEFTLIVCYDSSWNPCEYANSSYQVFFVYEGYDSTDDIYSASCYAYKIEQGDLLNKTNYTEIYHLNTSKHIPERM